MAKEKDNGIMTEGEGTPALTPQEIAAAVRAYAGRQRETAHAGGRALPGMALMAVDGDTVTGGVWGDSYGEVSALLAGAMSESPVMRGIVVRAVALAVEEGTLDGEVVEKGGRPGKGWMS